jgi:hypothetical protein
MTINSEVIAVFLQIMSIHLEFNDINSTNTTKHEEF